MGFTMATHTIARPVKRVTIRPKKCPNPLFKKWIEEWIEEAVAKDMKVRFGYRKALHSLKSYPLVLNSGKECAVLHDFGPKLCTRLDNKLAEYNKTQNGTGPPKTPRSKNQARKGNAKCGSSNTAFPGTGFSILPSTSTAAVSNQPTTQPPKRNTAVAPNSPAKKGKKLVESKPIEDLIFQAGTFKILLVVDNAEVSGNMKAKESGVREELTALGVDFEVRSLKVGDYAWVARETATGNEMVLPYIVERKRLDDLASSIKDGRYYEQKFRLKQCGIPNLIYMIESMGRGDLHAGLPLKTLQQASVNTQVHGGFMVKHTLNHKNSMEYLATMTRIISQRFKDKVLVQGKKENLPAITINDDLVSLMSFEEFNKGAAKIRKWRVREMFIKHLVQLRGCSVEKAAAIVQMYPTPSMLRAAYADSGEAQGLTLLAKLPKWRMREMSRKPRNLVQLRGCSVKNAAAIVQVYLTPSTLCAAYTDSGEAQGLALLAKLPVGDNRTLGPALSAVVYKVYAK